MTVRLSDSLGLEKIAKISQDLGIYDKFPYLISSSLGSLESSLIKITSAYATLANGGIKVSPIIIDAIYDNNGKFLYKGDTRKCENCSLDSANELDATLINNLSIPKIKNHKKTIFSKESSYQMTSFLMGVIERGTAKNINNFDFQIAGKTGTTNDNQDAWFIGYNSEITVGVYVGFDKPKTLGISETGSKVAAPIFGSFMKEAYNNSRPYPFKRPDGVKYINVDIKTGEKKKKNSIQEVFKKDFSFDEKSNIPLPSEQDNDRRGFY